MLFKTSHLIVCSTSALPMKWFQTAHRSIGLLPRAIFIKNYLNFVSIISQIIRHIQKENNQSFLLIIIMLLMCKRNRLFNMIALHISGGPGLLNAFSQNLKFKHRYTIHLPQHK